MNSDEMSRNARFIVGTGGLAAVALIWLLWLSLEHITCDVRVPGLLLSGELGFGQVLVCGLPAVLGQCDSVDTESCH